MESYPASLKKLIELLTYLPGIGEKSATRISLFLLSHRELCEKLGETIRELPFKVTLCKYCQNFSESEVCSICADPLRDEKKLCVVDNPESLAKIEETRAFSGFYFVLHNLLSPKEGIGPKELGIERLVGLIEKRGVEEVFLALSPTLSGENTSAYLYKVLKPYVKKITRIACGVPMGMEIPFVDPLTLKKAILKREDLSEE